MPKTNEPETAEKKGGAQNASGDQHLLHMWSPFTPKIGPDYQYYRYPPLRKYLSFPIFKFIVQTLCPILDLCVLGYRVTGRENMRALKGKRAVVVCNHIHPLDCTLMSLAMGWQHHFVLVLQSNLGIPVVRHAIRALGAVPVPDDSAYLESFTQQTLDVLEKDQKIMLYPEAVLHPYYDGLRKFHSGAFVFAARGRAPVCPLVITRHQPKGVFRWRKKPFLHIHVLPAIYPDPDADPIRDAARMKRETKKAMQAYYDAHSDAVWRPPTQAPKKEPAEKQTGTTENAEEKSSGNSR